MEHSEVSEVQVPPFTTETKAANSQRYRVEHYTCRNFAVYDGDQLVVVTVYKKGAAEVARRLNGAERVIRHLIKMDGSDGKGEIPSPS